MKKKVVLAYSGGLDTSIILKWLILRNYDVVTFTADLGNVFDYDSLRNKALAIGACDVIIEDVKHIFVDHYVYPLIYSQASYENRYLLGTAIARPLIAQRQIHYAHQKCIDYVAHGATGKGNDQVRFETSYYALSPNISIISPWRTWDMSSRNDLVRFAKKYSLLSEEKYVESEFSIDDNIYHTSTEGSVLENIENNVPLRAISTIKSLKNSLENSEEVIFSFVSGRCTAINNISLEPYEILEEANKIASRHGIGGLDVIESRITGMKSRGFYETPGGTLLREAHKHLESITLDGEVLKIKNMLSIIYGDLIYKGLWFSPEREMLQKSIDYTQEYVSGDVTLGCYKGNVYPLQRKSSFSLYDEDLSTFNTSDYFYNHEDAGGFIKTLSRRLRNYYGRKND